MLSSLSCDTVRSLDAAIDGTRFVYLPFGEGLEKLCDDPPSVHSHSPNDRRRLQVRFALMRFAFSCDEAKLRGPSRTVGVLTPLEKWAAWAGEEVVLWDGTKRIPGVRAMGRWNIGIGKVHWLGSSGLSERKRSK